MALPFPDESFDLVLSHAVIEHVADAPLYLRECRRVLAPEGRCYLSTAPYLSFAGAHLPRLRVQIPLHLIVGRKVAFQTFRLLARHAPWTLREPAHENSFIRDARNGIDKEVFAPLDEVQPNVDRPLRILVEGYANVWFKNVNTAIAATRLMAEEHELTVVAP